MIRNWVLNLLSNPGPVADVEVVRSNWEFPQSCKWWWEEYFFNNWFAGLGDDPDKHRETRPYIWFEEFSSLLNVWISYM